MRIFIYIFLAITIVFNIGFILYAINELRKGLRDKNGYPR